MTYHAIQNIINAVMHNYYADKLSIRLRFWVSAFPGYSSVGRILDL